MSNPYRDKLLGIGVVSSRSLGDSSSRDIRHPTEGYLMKETTVGDQNSGFVVQTEHAKGDRVDADVHPRALKLQVTNINQQGE